MQSAAGGAWPRPESQILQSGRTHDRRAGHAEEAACRSGRRAPRAWRAVWRADAPATRSAFAARSADGRRRDGHWHDARRTDGDGRSPAPAAAIIVIELSQRALRSAGAPTGRATIKSSLALLAPCLLYT